jgi:hypothetical protein
MRISGRAVMVGLLVWGAGFSAQAQAPNASATVSFVLDFPASDPSHYSIEVSEDGKSVYASEAKVNRESEDKDSFRLEFVTSAATRGKIFDLARKANYFQGQLEANKKNVALSGAKTLAYKDAQRNTSANYNFSLIPAVQELTTLFQSMSMTCEFGRKLEYDHHYQKLALDEELKRMEEMAKENSLGEIQAIAPILTKIANDPSVINGARARAQRLLSAGEP